MGVDPSVTSVYLLYRALRPYQQAECRYSLCHLTPCSDCIQAWLRRCILPSLKHYFVVRFVLGFFFTAFADWAHNVHSLTEHNKTVNALNAQSLKGFRLPQNYLIEEPRIVSGHDWGVYEQNKECALTHLTTAI